MREMFRNQSIQVLVAESPDLSQGAVMCPKCFHLKRMDLAKAIIYGWPRHCEVVMDLVPRKGSYRPGIAWSMSPMHIRRGRLEKVN